MARTSMVAVHTLGCTVARLVCFVVVAASVLCCQSGALAALFLPLQYAPDQVGYRFTTATGVSADGRTVVGIASFAGVDLASTTWDAATGLLVSTEPTPGLIGAFAKGISDDGTVIYGNRPASPDSIEGFRSGVSGAPSLLGSVQPGSRYRYAIPYGASHDASVIVGYENAGLGGEWRDYGFIWTSQSGLARIDQIGSEGDWDGASGVSSDGRYVLGSAVSSGHRRAVIWDRTANEVSVVQAPDGTSDVHGSALSADGRVVIGALSALPTEGLQVGRPFIYDAVRGLRLLPQADDGGQWGFRDLSADGSVLIGHYQRQFESGEFETDGVIWEESFGVRRLSQVFAQLGLTEAGEWTSMYIEGISADGRTIVGYGRNPEGLEQGYVAVIPSPGVGVVGLVGVVGVFVRRRRCGAAVAAACVCGLAGAASGAAFTPLQFTAVPEGARYTVATGISADGRTVVGVAPFDGVGRATTTWDASTGLLVSSEPAPGLIAMEASGISEEGTVVYGSVATSADSRDVFRGEVTGGSFLLGSLHPDDRYRYAYPTAASRDASLIVGNEVVLADDGWRSFAFMWSSQSGLTRIDQVGSEGEWNSAYGVSADGRYVVGNAGSWGNNRAVIWDRDAAEVSVIEPPEGFDQSSGLAISGDARVVLGEISGPAGLSTQRSFIYDAERGLRLLPFASGGGLSSFTRLSADGSVALGGYWRDLGSEGYESDGLIWDESFGVRRFAQVFEQLGLAGAERWTRVLATGISADGRTIVGYGMNPEGLYQGFVAVIPSPGVGVLGVLAATMVGARRRGLVDLQ